MRINKDIYENKAEMFTRVPTFIPTSTESIDELRCSTRATKLKSLKASNGTAKTPGLRSQETTTRKKRKTKTLRKRIGAIKSEEKAFNVHQQLLLQDEPDGEISRQDDDMEDTTNINDPCRDRESSPGISLPYRAASNILLSTDARLGGQPSCLARDMQGINEDVTEFDVLKGSLEDREMLTQPKLHKRNRRKLVEDTSPHASETKKHARDSVDKIDSENTSKYIETLDRTGSRLGYRRGEGTRSFRSKIPVRFPNIQGNKSPAYQVPAKPRQSALPPIYTTSLRSGNNSRSGKVTQSIQNYQNILENDFKRLGENLDTTFKLLNEYIERACKNNYN